MTQWGLDTLFNPGKRHMDEEKQRLQSTREEVGDSSGGKRIDLDSGKVVISRRHTDEATADEEPTDSAPEQSADTATGSGADSRRDTDAEPDLATARGRAISRRRG